ncbi:hypothetical protein [Caldalkalibacillus mannanilyticus]|uniref:hypothetical protein n=1 Tax=Caldalkalibacillus mannanilyticus TaxID=1418 RepID=UPI000468903F|nr:hypothetical protein [Caldalkalibacillus mannanilyticus]
MKKVDMKKVFKKGLPLALATSLVFSYGVGDIEAKEKGKNKKNEVKVEKERKSKGFSDIEGYWGQKTIEKMDDTRDYNWIYRWDVSA